MSTGAQVDPHDKMRARDVSKVARGQQATAPPHEYGTVSPPPPPSSTKADQHRNKTEEESTTEADANLDSKIRQCFASYMDYHKCMKEKGKNAAECDKLAKTSLSACPREWIDKWNKERERGTLRAPI